MPCGTRRYPLLTQFRKQRASVLVAKFGATGRANGEIGGWPRHLPSTHRTCVLRFVDHCLHASRKYAMLSGKRWGLLLPTTATIPLVTQARGTGLKYVLIMLLVESTANS